MTNEPLIVDLEELKRVKEYLREINQTPFENIRWQINNHDVDMTPAAKKEWCFTGLSNWDYGYELVDANITLLDQIEQIRTKGDAILSIMVDITIILAGGLLLGGLINQLHLF